MKLNLLFLLSKSLIFPHATKKSIGYKSILMALFCVSLSVIPFIISLNLSDSMIKKMVDNLIYIGSYPAKVVFYQNNIADVAASNLPETSKTPSTLPNTPPETPNTSPDTSYLSLVKKMIMATDLVSSIYPLCEAPCVVVGKSKKQGGVLRAASSSFFSSSSHFLHYITVKEGSIPSYLLNPSSVIISSSMASSLGVTVGDSIKLLLPKFNKKNLSPLILRFTVRAIITSGYEELDNLWLYCNYEEVKDKLLASNALYSLLLEFNDFVDLYGNRSQEIVGIQEACGNLNKTLTNIGHAYSWQELNKEQVNNFYSTKTLLSLVLFLIIISACVNIAVSVLLLIVEKKREITLLNALGTPKHCILIPFITLSVLIGALGSLLGGIVAQVLSFNILSIIRALEHLINRVISLFNPLSSPIKIIDPTYYIALDKVTLSYSPPFFCILIISFICALLSLLVTHHYLKASILTSIKRV